MSMLRVPNTSLETFITRLPFHPFERGQQGLKCILWIAGTSIHPFLKGSIEEFICGIKMVPINSELNSVYLWFFYYFLFNEILLLFLKYRNKLYVLKIVFYIINKKTREKHNIKDIHRRINILFSCFLSYNMK